MKYSTVALMLLGLISTAEARVPNALTQIQARTSNRMAVLDSSSDDSDDSDDDTLVQLDQPCEYLDETQDELDYQIDKFSRTLDPRHWTNVLNLADAIGKKTGKKP